MNRPGHALLLAAMLVTAPSAAPAQGSSYEQLQAYSSVLNHVRLNYADSVAYPELVRASIVGMLRALDPHSWYASRADWERLNALERGELAETGILLGEGDRTAVVLGVVPDSPADRGGILPGDRLTAIDDTTVAGRRVSDLSLRLAGDKGSKVRLRFARGPIFAADTYSVTLKRGQLERSAVSEGRLLADGRTGWIRLWEFTPTAEDDLRRGIRRLRKDGATGLALDLRQNPGGSVTAAVEIASLFLPKGALVFSTRGRKRAVDEQYLTTKDGEFRDLPLVLLVDAGSASAAEALAGSLQDHDRALILGRRTFGKALMQSPFFVEPSGDVVWLTVGRVITPSGRSIQRAYRGLGVEQYESFAGSAGTSADTAEVFRTDGGRTVRGGGGIAPDVEVPSASDQPAWWSAAADGGLVLAVADSAALHLPPDPGALRRWSATPAEWEQLVPPLLSKVRARLGPVPDPPAEVHAAIARSIARRVAAVRWPPSGAIEFDVANHPDLRAAQLHIAQAATLQDRGAR